jgi:hypothetical protein
MNPFQIHANGINDLIVEMGTDCPTFTKNNIVYQIIPGSAVRRKDLVIGGFQIDADLAFTALLAQFNLTASAFKDAFLQNPITYLGDKYKIDSVTILPGGLQVHVLANSLSQNA